MKHLVSAVVLAALLLGGLFLYANKPSVDEFAAAYAEEEEALFPGLTANNVAPNTRVKDLFLVTLFEYDDSTYLGVANRIFPLSMDEDTEMASLEQE